MKDKPVEKKETAMEVVKEPPKVTNIIMPVIPKDPEEEGLLQLKLDAEVEEQLDKALAVIQVPNPTCTQDAIHAGIAAMSLKAAREAERRGLTLVHASLKLDYVNEEGEPYGVGISLAKKYPVVED